MKIGFLINSKSIPIWVSELIRAVSHIPGGQVSFIASLQIQTPEDSSWLARKVVELDRSIWPDKKNLFTPVSAETCGVQPVHDFKAHLSDEKIYLNENDSKALINLNADLIIYPGQTPVVLSGPFEFKNLLWTINYAATPEAVNLMPGYQEWFNSCDANFIGICQHNPDTSKRIIASRQIRALHFSYNRNLSAVVTATAELIHTCVEKIISGKQLPVVNPQTVSVEISTVKPQIPTRTPNSVQLLIGFTKLFIRAGIRFVAGRFYHAEAWSLFYKFSVSKTPWTDLNKFTPLLPPKDKIWADPFVISASNENYIFLEEMAYGGKGRIICMHLNAKGETLNVQSVIEKPFHLSYPFLIQHDETWYMIPESSENNTVDLYECVGFPYQWKLRKNILSGIKALDSTIVRHNEKFWLFCTVQSHDCGSPNDVLHIYFTEDLLNGEWKPHRNNPVMIDAYNARPAGRFFMHEGNLYRPAQICIPDYGNNMGLNRVLELTEDTYREERITRLTLEEHGIYKIHTFNFTEHFTIVDGALRRFKF